MTNRTMRRIRSQRAAAVTSLDSGSGRKCKFCFVVCSCGIVDPLKKNIYIYISIQTNT